MYRTYVPLRSITKYSRVEYVTSVLWKSSWTRQSHRASQFLSGNSHTAGDRVAMSRVHHWHCLQIHCYSGVLSSVILQELLLRVRESNQSILIATKRTVGVDEGWRVLRLIDYWHNSENSANRTDNPSLAHCIRVCKMWKMYMYLLPEVICPRPRNACHRLHV